MGKYLEFNHAYNGQYITTNNNLINFYTYPSGNTSTTILMWVYPITDGAILGEGPDFNMNYPKINIEMSSGSMYFGFWDGATVSGSSTLITSSKWTHLTLTYNQFTGDMFGYVNGVSACTANLIRVFPDYKGTPNLYYGIAYDMESMVNPPNNAGWPHMRFGNFRLFNYTLEPNEVEYEYLNSFDTWVCPVVYYNTENPQSYPGVGSGNQIDDIEGNSKLDLFGDSGLPTSATSLCNTYITFNSGDNQFGRTHFDIKQFFNNNDVSIFMWVNTLTGGDGNILTEDSISYNNSTIEFYQNKFYLGFYQSGLGIQYVSSTNLNYEEWYYVGLTYNTLTGDLVGYVNGESIGSINFIRDTGTNLYYNIAKATGHNMMVNSFWNGSMGTFQVWNQVLTPANVLNNYLKSVNNWICPIINYDISNINSYPGIGTGDYVYDLSVNSDGYLPNSGTSATTLCNTYLEFSASSSQYLVTQTDVSTLISTNNDQSIFMWVNVKSDGVILSELGQNYINTGFHYSQIEMFGGAVTINIYDGSTLNPYSLGTTNYSNWNYIGFTWKNSSSEVIGYLNGMSAFTTTVSRQFPYPSNGLFYGIAAEDSIYNAAGGYCDLDLGTFQMFGQTLTPEKVLNNYDTSFTKWICPVIKYNTNNYLCYTGGTEFFDLSGNGLDAGLAGSPYSGVSNCFTYVQFDGSNRFVANNSVSYFPNNKFSLFMWVYPEDRGQVVNYYDGTDIFTIIEHYDETFIFGLYNGASYDYFSASTPSSYNEWYNVGVTYDGTTLTGYINGDITGSIPVSWSLPGQLSFRNEGGGTVIFESGGFNGRMGTFEVWNKVLPYNVIYENYVNTINDVTNPCLAFFEYIVVAGGGGSMYDNRTIGGSGAGGVSCGTLNVSSGGIYTITVGAGGAGWPTGGSAQQGNQGNPSSIGYGMTTLVSCVGGGATCADNSTYSGGSGAGASVYSSGILNTAGPGTPGQGNNGGDGYLGASSNAGGGGGASQVGQDGNPTNSGGDGGNGFTWVDGNTYGGGGGGSTTNYIYGTGGTGGTGGGGNGVIVTTASNGTSGDVNTGGGAGGGYSALYSTAGGGSGIVIIRYPGVSPLATGGTITYVSGYVYHTFTGSGTLTIN